MSNLILDALWWSPAVGLWCYAPRHREVKATPYPGDPGPQLGASVTEVRSFGRPNDYRATVAYSPAWHQARNIVAQASFDTLEEAQQFAALVYQLHHNSQN